MNRPPREEKLSGSSLRTSTKKSTNTSFRGFVSIDQEMGKEIALMFFKPTKKMSFSESGHLAGKV